MSIILKNRNYTEYHREDAEGVFSVVLCVPLRREKKIFKPVGRQLMYFLSLILVTFSLQAQQVRQDISLNNDWLTIATSNDKELPNDLYQTPATKDWKKVNIPHNWDAYEGYRRLLHGNRHGNAWYKKTFSTRQSKTGKRFFLFFEGVGSYATVFLNGKKAGEHAGGRTTFTIDITGIIKTDGSNNQLDVHAGHPSGIKDLPWVCGGCSEERGFSEGSQPMGIFRPVHLIVTNDLRIQPFGIHAWADITGNKARLHINATLKNYSKKTRQVTITNQLLDAGGKIIASASGNKILQAGDSLDILQKDIAVANPQLWSPDRPYLYKIVTIIKEGIVVDKMSSDFGFRSVNWKTATKQFTINGRSLFINGVAEYEHLLGQSHAFSQEQVRSRMKWLKAAGFNAFRDGHQPHNLLYGQLCDENGILWWTQLSAHIWYNTPAFRNNFKQLLREWVIERRNSPSVVLWGLQNESQIPEDFAKECTELIRQLDPTTSSQRLVTTCNGGSGTDWDVPQNWTGTYGGDPNTYASDLKKQVLIGEYGAWRTIDLHTEGGFVQNGILSEDRMTQLMEQKVRLGESVKDSSAGQFFWLLTSHDNPGRVQGGEGLRELDRIGPVNYKGTLTPWEEPLDVFYMFRSNYASKTTSPMVYIVSHTWPGRWTMPGKKDGIIVYSNCDEVELFNDINDHSLGKRKREGPGTHFRWDGVNIQYNVLYAVGYVNGKVAAKDTIVLHYLPKAPHFERLYASAKPIAKPQPGYNYIYRINCGGPEYRDEFGNLWQADRATCNMQYAISNRQTAAGSRRSVTEKKDSSIAHCLLPVVTWGSKSWTNDFPGMPWFFGSQRKTYAPLRGTKDWELFQDFRYGKDKLMYEFPLPDGEYLVEFYFIEPWLNIGGGMDARGMRLFDVSINNKTVINDLDIWKEAGTNTVLKKTVKTRIAGGRMIISFPESKSGQAIISAIAIASTNKGVNPGISLSLITDLSDDAKLVTWLDRGNELYPGSEIRFHSLPSNLYGADWLQFATRKKEPSSFILNQETDVFIAATVSQIQDKEMEGFENTKTEIELSSGDKYFVYRKRFASGAKVIIPANNKHMVAMLPATSMQPAYDLKTVTAYRTNVATVSGSGIKEQFGGRESAVLKSKEAATIEWPIQTGVADIYSITIKYYYPADTVKAKVQLIGAGNTMMLEETVSFTFTRPGKWNSVTINTGSMINAGNYIVRVVVENAEGLVLSGIDVQ